MDEPQTVRDLMTPEPIVLDAAASVGDAARAMRARDVGDVLVRRDGKLCGIVTDRDIVVRVLAAHQEGAVSVRLEDICSGELECLAPDTPIREAIKLMEEKAIRRIPIVEDGRPLGILSLGDLAVARDRSSALGKISAAPPTR
jgi:CBS domain-containing protein